MIIEVWLQSTDEGVKIDLLLPALLEHLINIKELNTITIVDGMLIRIAATSALML